MADHDQRFKNLLQEFFAEFVQLFFPDWAGRFDFAGLEWLNAEVFPDPPQESSAPGSGRAAADADQVGAGDAAG